MVRDDSDLERSLGVIGGEESREFIVSNIGVAVLRISVFATWRRRGRRNGATSARRERRHLPFLGPDCCLLESGNGERRYAFEPFERNLDVNFL